MTAPIESIERRGRDNSLLTELALKHDVPLELVENMLVFEENYQTMERRRGLSSTLKELIDTAIAERG